MNNTVRIDAAGRLVLPRRVRDQLHLSAGTRLQLDVESNAVRLTPVPDPGVRLVRRGKRLVVVGTPALSPGQVKTAIAADREERGSKLARRR